MLVGLGEDPLGIRAAVKSSPESEVTEATSPTGHHSSTAARSRKASGRQARKSPPPDAAAAEAAVSSRQQQAQRPAASSSTTTLLTTFLRSIAKRDHKLSNQVLQQRQHQPQLLHYIQSCMFKYCT